VPIDTLAACATSRMVVPMSPAGGGSLEAVPVWSGVGRLYSKNSGKQWDATLEIHGKYPHTGE
jgi:hypothetical protein